MVPVASGSAASYAPPAAGNATTVAKAIPILRGVWSQPRLEVQKLRSERGLPPLDPPDPKNKERYSL